jgi:hypothetical protein
MKESFRLNFLSICAVASLSLFILPVVLLLRLLLFESSGGFTAVAMFFAISSVGFMAGRLVFKEDAAYFETAAKWPFFKLLLFFFNVKEKGRFVSNMVGFLSLLIPVAAGVLFFSGNGILRTAFEVFFMTLPYFISLRNSDKRYSDIFSNRIAYFGFFVMAAVIVAANYLQQAFYLKWYFYIILYIYILLYLVLKNQEDIDSNIYSKKYIQKSILPRNMRGFNLVAVLGLYCVILLLFNLKTVVLTLLKAGGKILGYIIIAILWIMEHILPPMGGTQQEKAQMPADFGFFGGAEEAVHPFLNLLGNTFKAFIILYVLYKLLPFLLKKAAVLVIKLMDLLRKAFSHRFPASATNEYDDETETIKPVRDVKKQRSLRKSIEGARQELGKITDPVERIRRMYGILLKMLESCGVNLEKYDTTLEIYSKSSCIDKLSEPFLPVTEQYNKVRYGGSLPDKASLSSYEIKYNEATGIIGKSSETANLHRYKK